MVNNDVSFILSFVILMEKYRFWGSPLGIRACATLVFSLGYLVSNGRQALLGGIRLGGSATLEATATEFILRFCRVNNSLSTLPSFASVLWTLEPLFYLSLTQFHLPHVVVLYRSSPSLLSPHREHPSTPTPSRPSPRSPSSLWARDTHHRALSLLSSGP